MIVQRVFAGSIKVEYTLVFNSSMAQTSIDADVSTFTRDPANALSLSELEQFGITQVGSAEVMPATTTASSDSGLSTGAIVGIAVGGGVGGLLVIGVLILIIMKSRGGRSVAPAKA